MKGETRRTLIVGAGIFGITAALELRRRGHQVTIVDRGSVPHPEASSTDISKAVRADYGADLFYTELAEEAIDGWHAWNEKWVSPPFHRDGFLLMTRRPLAAGEFEGDGFELLQGRGYPLQRLDAEALRRRVPAWKCPAYVDGYLNPRSGWVESGRVVATCAAAARAAGVALIESKCVRELRVAGSRVSGVLLDDGESLQADEVLLCAGAWTPHLLTGLDRYMQTVGQPVLHFRPADPRPFTAPSLPVWAADISRSGYYGFPAGQDGIFKVGHHGRGRAMHPDDPKSVDPATQGAFREFLEDTFNGLEGADLVDSRVCLYCDTWDGNFWIDRHPDLVGLTVACGGCGHGFKFAPVLGAIIADVHQGRPNRWASRFAWREPRGRATEQARADD